MPRADRDASALVGTKHDRAPQPHSTAQDEVADLLVELIRINTSNPTHPERPAAEWVAAQARRGRHRVADHRGRAGPRVHGRADRGQPTQPRPAADPRSPRRRPRRPAEWSVDPFAGEIRDGYVWGRGAIDMKDMDAMTLALVRQWARTGRKPPRDIVLAFVSDEEAGGRKGAHYLVDHHADLFADCTEAISEVGGFSVLAQRPGAGLPDPDGREGHQLAAAARHSAARARLDDPRRQRGHPAGRGRVAHRQPRWPIVITDTVRATVEGSPRSPGRTWTPTRRAVAADARIGARMIGATIRNTANPTMLEAGYKTNVIPGTAEATIDAGSCPARRTGCWPTSTSCSAST